MHLTRFCVMLFTVALPLLARGQATTMSNHQHPSSNQNTIDGQVHPELIPDQEAYRLFFLATSRPAAASDQQLTHQAAQLQKTGLQSDDQRTVAVVLTNFQALYLSLITTYNKAATTAWQNGDYSSSGLQAFLLQRDLIVQATQNELRAKLSGRGWAILQTHVQNEKKHMIIGSAGGAQ